MEHIVHFAIGIDDDAIRKRIEDNAYEDIVKELMKKAENEMPKLYGKFPNWYGMTEKAVKQLIDENKDTIIDKATDKLVESFKRTKVFKEAMAKAIE